MWYRDPRHPELGAMYCPDEYAAAAVPPGMETCDPPAPVQTLTEIIAESGQVTPAVAEQAIVVTAAGWASPDADPLADVRSRAAAIQEVFQISAENIARAFGVPSELARQAGPTYEPSLDTGDYAVACSVTSCPNYGDPSFGEGECPADHAGPYREILSQISSSYGLNAPKGELDRRLAESRCYWCGLPINSDDPLEMFDQEECQVQWRIATQADVTQGGITVNPRGAGMPEFEDSDRTPPPGDTYPSWLGTPRRDLGLISPLDAPLGHLSHLTGAQLDPPVNPPHPSGHDYGPPADERWWTVTESRTGFDVRDVPPLPETLDYVVLQTAAPLLSTPTPRNTTIPSIYGVMPNRLRLKGIVVADLSALPDTAARRSDGAFAVGTMSLPGTAALRQLEHGPYGDRGGWPLAELREAHEAGFRPALPRGLTNADLHHFVQCSGVAVPAVRWCENCGSIEAPAVHRARFPRIEHYGAGIVEATSVLADHIVCQGCLMPYPGPIQVPLWRDDPQRGVSELAVVHQGGVEIRALSQEAVQDARTPGSPIARVAWEYAYQDASRQAHPWQCPLPGCGEATEEWVAVGAEVSMLGWLIRPIDQEPLLLGLCPQHHYQLAYEVMVNETYSRYRTERMYRGLHLWSLC